MDHKTLLRLAKSHGTPLVVVDHKVLRENYGMLEMCHALGFALAPDPADGTLLQVRKTLQPHG